MSSTSLPFGPPDRREHWLFLGKKIPGSKDWGGRDWWASEDLQQKEITINAKKLVL